jgi:hypothetical protein
MTARPRFSCPDCAAGFPRPLTGSLPKLRSTGYPPSPDQTTVVMACAGIVWLKQLPSDCTAKEIGSLELL